MADLAHDASGPASSEPAGITRQRAGPSASSDRGKLRVFISYSRDDLDFADQLDAALSTYGFECLIDRHGISGGEDWKQRLGNLISEADTVVFVLSPSSARSDICAWEVEEATRLNKRILPLVCRPLEGMNPPQPLRDRNYIYFHKEPKVPDSGFGTGLANLVTALNTDFDWLREHTRYLQRAIEWDAGGRPTDRLLSGNDILEAKAWAARRPKGAPEPTTLHLEFIRASEEEAEARSSAQRKQLEAMAAAQAERETALAEREEALKQAADAQQRREEALKQAADAQRKRARIRNIALVVVSILAVVAALLGWSAVNNADQANNILGRALTILAKVQHYMDPETEHEAIALFQAGVDRGNPAAMYDLGVVYMFGQGVPQDYAKGRELLEEAAAEDYPNAMFTLGMLFDKGDGVPQDYAKARDWLEKAAANDYAEAMNLLGALYEEGRGVPQDYAKARDWYEKAAATGDANAKMALEQLPIREAATAGRYDEALRLEEAFAAKLEAEQTKRDGKPGEQVATELNQVEWYALFAKEFTKALTVADRAHTLFPNNLMIETNRAHALMFIGHEDEAKALYLAHKGEVREQSGKLWEQIIADDFAEFRKVGLTSPMMADVEKELGISR